MIPIKYLSQTREFASDKKVQLINGSEKLNARVLGPLRKQTQIEISITDAHELKMKKIPPINLSGDLMNSNNKK